MRKLPSISISKLSRLAGFLLVYLVCFIQTSIARESIFEKPSQFLKRHYKKIPKTQVRTLTDKDQKALAKILGHRYAQQRVRYWSVGDKTAWILEEVGKSEPITTGFITRKTKDKQNQVVTQISEVKVLIYRESHGSEVRHPFFTKQFQGSTLNGYKLKKKVDGIVGSTLSVRAITKLSAVALYLSTTNKLEVTRPPHQSPHLDHVPLLGFLYILSLHHP